MSAQSWSVRGIDPKVREAAREAAARQGMSLGEYLSQALAATADLTPTVQTQEEAAVGAGEFNSEDLSDLRSRLTARLAQRMEQVERRTQLAITGLDRAVSTIDRSVLGLAARIDTAEVLASQANDRAAEALEEFRKAMMVRGDQATPQYVQNDDLFFLEEGDPFWTEDPEPSKSTSDGPKEQAGEPSMEEILASIRRIISEEEVSSSRDMGGKANFLHEPSSSTPASSALARLAASPERNWSPDPPVESRNLAAVSLTKDNRGFLVGDSKNADSGPFRHSRLVDISFWQEPRSSDKRIVGQPK